MVRSTWDATISVRRASPNSALTFSSSSRMTSIRRSGLVRMRISSPIRVRISWYSARSLSCSRPVRRCRRSSRMAWACSGDRKYLPSRRPYCGSRSSGRQASAPARSTMASTALDSQGVAIRRSLASAGVGEFLISSITGSMFDRATAWPSRIWPRSRALRSS
ncbi:hypothetical protein D3C84_518430 [compost metagenome]